MINQKIETNLIPGHVNPRISVSQYDKSSRTLQFALYNGNTAYNVVSGTTALIQGTKPDKHGFQYSASVTVGSNIVTAALTEQMTAVAGDVLCEIVLNKGAEKLATANFILDVEKAALGDDTVISDSELPLIITLATQQMEAAAASATLAESYAKGGTNTRTGENTDNAKYYKEQAASSASSASGSATTATNKATAAAGSATLAESYAKGGTNTRTGENTDNAKYYKEQAASSASSASGSASTATTKASDASSSATLAQSYAKGGTGTRSGEDSDNAKYYKEFAASSSTNASNKAAEAGASVILAESYAKGGTNSRTGENTDNSKYYKEQAASSASAAQASADRAQSYSVNVPYIGDNGHWYIWNTTSGTYVDSGIDASITVQIADITMLAPSATPYVTNSGTDTDPIFHLFIPRGKGIASIEKTSTSSLTDTYTITYSDGATTNFQVTNGKGVVSISKTGTSGLVDTYTIAFNDGDSTTYQVTNGKGITSFEKTGTSGLVDTYTVTFNDGNPFTFTVTNGKTAYASAVDGGYSKTEEQFESDLANFGDWATAAQASAATASQAATDAEAAADLAAQYAGFVTPHFIIQNNRLYIKDDAVGEFVTANNRLYIKLAS